jgi:type II secretory pathway pseudopilin PulG
MNKKFIGKFSAFTLAEVLITLGIIGVVSAMTIPSLMSAYKKKSYYIQFMRARNVIENALRMYANDYDCVVTDGSCRFKNEEEIINFGKYFKGVQYVTVDNYSELCVGYDKIPGDINEGASFCDNGDSDPKSDTTGFLTIDGMLLLLTTDAGHMDGSVVDVNGPNSGPNTYGRDIFYFYLSNSKYYCNNIWGISKACKQQRGLTYGAYCYEKNYFYTDCGARLIEEGKMNY